MDTITVEGWLKIISGTGLGIGCMFLGIRWLLADRMGILQALERERTERIAELEASAKACRDDRQTMHVEIHSLQTEVRGLLYKLVSLAAGGNCPELSKMIDNHIDVSPNS